MTLFWRVKGFTWTNAPSSIGFKVGVKNSTDVDDFNENYISVHNPIDIPEDDYKELSRNFADTNPPTNEKDLVCLQNMYWASKSTNYIVDEFTEWKEYETSEEGFFQRERYWFEFYLNIQSSFGTSSPYPYFSLFTAYFENNKYYIDFTFSFLQFGGSMTLYLEWKGPGGEYGHEGTGGGGTSWTDPGMAYLGSDAFRVISNPGDEYNEGNITLNFLDKSLNFPYRYYNDNSLGGALEVPGGGMFYLNDVATEMNDPNFGINIMDQITLDATEYWPYNPNDGDGPIYDEDTGEQIRPF